jgi:hypothetical protein
MSNDYDLFDELEADSKVNETELDRELLRIPYLQSKWMKRYIALNRQLRAADRHTALVKNERSNFYLGLASEDDYRVEPLNRKALKTDLPDRLSCDVEYCTAREDADTLRDVTVAVEKFVTSLNNRGFNLKAAVDYLRWKNGG